MAATRITKTAHEVYSERLQAVQERLKSLEAKVLAHSNREAANERDWGFSGDMGHLEQLLEEAEEFLS